MADSDPEVGLAFREAVALIRSLGADAVDDIDFETWKPNGGQREDLFGDVLLREGFQFQEDHFDEGQVTDLFSGI
jgi:hypothetical protein